MPTPLDKKSSVEEIRRRFDADVERFANLETGQSATLDAPLVMELITRCALSCTPRLHRVLDIGCGAGNNTLKLLQTAQRPLDCDLLDISYRMLARAEERLKAQPVGAIRLHHVDFRDADLADNTYDVVIAAAVLHHLRDDTDWEHAFAKLYRITAPGGSLWITDLIHHDIPGVQEVLWERYGDYLRDLRGEEYRDSVFANIDDEDSPRSLDYQVNLLRQVGFRRIEIVHKTACFAAFGAVKD